MYPKHVQALNQGFHIQTLNTTLQREIQFQTIKSKKYKRKNQNVSKTCAGSQPGFSYPNS